MNRRIAAVAATVLAVGAVSAGFVIAAAEDDDRPITGSSLERAASAALSHTGGGTIVATEVGDDGAAYGVEVRLDDGRVVEVNLNGDFEVIGQEADDDDGAGDRDDGSDDD